MFRPPDGCSDSAELSWTVCEIGGTDKRHAVDGPGLKGLQTGCRLGLETGGLPLRQNGLSPQ